MKPVLFYTIGYPGAGKTTLAQGLSRTLHGIHLRGDKIGLEIFRFPTYSQEERRIVYAEMDKRAGNALKAGRHVFYDAATNTIAQRDQAVALAKKHGYQAIGLWVQTPIGVAKRRAGTARDAGIIGNVIRVIPPHIFDQYVAAFEAPQPHEFIVRISGDAQFYLQYRRLQRQLRMHRIATPTFVSS